MKKIILFFAFSFGLLSPAVGQSMSDSQVLKEAVAAKKSGASESEIATQLMQHGATMEQIQRLRSQYAKQITNRGLDSNVDNAIADAPDRMRVNNEVADNEIVTHERANAPEFVEREPASMGKRVFGRDIFNNKSLTFEPQMNIATPQNYVLGPGDQLIIDIYGASQETHTLTVSPDGDVTIPLVWAMSYRKAFRLIRSGSDRPRRRPGLPSPR